MKISNLLLLRAWRVSLTLAITGTAAILFAQTADHKAAQQRPIYLGTSGGNIEDRSNLYCCSGTLGALVEDAFGIRYILSNNHVLARSNQARQSEAVNQPGQIDQGCSQQGVVAHLSNFVPIKFGKGKSLPPNQVDAAIAAVVDGAVRSDGAILAVGTVSSQIVPASVGQAVQKSGRTTGHTTGGVAAIDVTVDVGYSQECGGAANQKARFVNQVRITPGTFSAGGDSGSVIFENGSVSPDDGLPRAVGLLFAGSSSSTLANPIDAVLSSLNVSFVGGAPSAPVPSGTISGTVTDDAANPISGALVKADSGQSATTTSTGFYEIANVPEGGRSITASATGFASANEGVTVVEDQVSVVNFALAPLLEPTQAIAECVIYSGSGGKTGDKDLLFTVRVVDDFGTAVAGATVNISVTRNGSHFANGTGAASNGSGDATYIVRNAANGTYAITVTAIQKAGLAFEGTTPPNSLAKGTDPLPASFCRNGLLAAAADENGAALQRARNVKERHGNALFQIQDVIGHGVSRDADGRPVIEVYLAKENAAARANIPAHVENVPVRVIVTGEFIAF